MPSGFIVDFLTLPGDDTVPEIMSTKATQCLKEEGAVTISCCMLKNTPYYRILRKTGFIHRHSGSRLGARIHGGNLSREFVANPSNWYFVLRDTDSL